MTKEKEEIVSKENNLKVYEVGYLLSPNIAEENVLSDSGKIRDIIEKNEGIFLSEGVPEMRNLTYAIKKSGRGNKQFGTAYFGWIKFEATSESEIEIKNKLDKEENVLRFLIIKTVKENLKNYSLRPAKFLFDKIDKDGKDGGKKVAKEDLTEKTEGTEETKEGKQQLDQTIEDLVIE